MTDCYSLCLQTMKIAIAHVKIKHKIFEVFQNAFRYQHTRKFLFCLKTLAAVAPQDYNASRYLVSNAARYSSVCFQ